MTVLDSEESRHIRATARPVPVRAQRDHTLQPMFRWIDERTNLVSAVNSILYWPVPKYVQGNLLYALGGLTLISFLVQMITGILMGFYYDPSVEGAYNSVDYITYLVPMGWLVRGVHYYNASAIVILVLLHMLRTFAYGTYKKPREITWLSGVVLLVIVLAFAFTGYTLPWDQRGYWSLKVSIGIVNNLPFVGESTANLLAGGPNLGQLTLTRFHMIHTVLLPMALLSLLALHLFQHRYHGVAPAITKRGNRLAAHFVPFYPNWVILDLVLGLILVSILFYLSWQQRAPLEFPADSSSTDFDPRPEWYFLFLYQLLRYVPGRLEPLATIVMPLLILGSMILLPFIDRGEERRIWRKPVIQGTALVYITAIVVLTWLAF